VGNISVHVIAGDAIRRAHCQKDGRARELPGARSAALSRRLSPLRSRWIGEVILPWLGIENVTWCF